MTPRKPRQLMDIAIEVKIIIDRADKAGIHLDDGNVIDLLADNLTEEPLSTLRDALVVSGHGARFPKATRSR